MTRENLISKLEWFGYQFNGEGQVQNFDDSRQVFQVTENFVTYGINCGDTSMCNEVSLILVEGVCGNTFDPYRPSVTLMFGNGGFSSIKFPLQESTIIGRR